MLQGDFWLTQSGMEFFLSYGLTVSCVQSVGATDAGFWPVQGVLGTGNGFQTQELVRYGVTDAVLGPRGLRNKNIQWT